MSVLIIKNSLIKELNISPKLIINEVKKSLIKHAKGDVLLEPKVTIRPKNGTFFTAMPGGINDEYLGLKLIEQFKKTPEHPTRPGVFGTMLLNHDKSGELLSVMDATWLTSIRTGAIAAITIEVLADKNTDEISIMGLGNAAMATIVCIKELLPKIKTINLLKYKNTQDRLIKRFEGQGFKFNIIDTLEDFIKSSKVVLTSANYAKEPFVKKEWLPDGLLAIPIHARGWEDCNSSFDKIYTDDYAHTKHIIKNLFAQLGEVLSGEKKGREIKNAKIIAYNIGNVLADITVAKLIYEKALKNKKGLFVDIADSQEEYYI